VNDLGTLTEANYIIDLIKKKVDGYPTQYLLAGNKVVCVCIYIVTEFWKITHMGAFCTLNI